MRSIIRVGAVIIAVGIPATPSFAQDGGFMWCSATAGNGVDATRYYSEVFMAGSAESAAKAQAFKAEAESAEASAASISARCYASDSEPEADVARSIAIKKAPGETLDSVR